MIALTGGGSGVWRLVFYESDLDRGLAALNKAITSGQRPVEARHDAE